MKCIIFEENSRLLLIIIQYIPTQILINILKKENYSLRDRMDCKTVLRLYYDQLTFVFPLQLT